MLLRNSSSKNAIKLWKSYSTQVPKLTSAPFDEPSLVTKCENGISVVGYDRNQPASFLAFVFKSGTRYENVRNAGVSQKLRLVTGKKCEEVSAFMHTRRAQQLGSKLDCQVGRETISYTMTGLIGDHFPVLFSHVSNAACKPLFRRWELEECLKELNIRNVIKCPMEGAFDLMHSAAYHGRGLGNGLLIPDYNRGEITDVELDNFWRNTHTSSNLVVIGAGIDHELLGEQIVNMTSMMEDKSTEPARSQYFGGELRKETDGDLAYVCMGGPGASLRSTKESDALFLAQFAVSAPSGVKYGSNAASVLQQSITDAGVTGKIEAFSVSYSDSGLFGFKLVTPSETAGIATKAAVNAMKNFKVTKDQLKLAKKRAKTQLMLDLEPQESLVNYIANEVLHTGAIRKPSEKVAAIESLTEADVNKAISSVIKAKPCMGAYGGIYYVPFLDEL